MKTDLDNTGKPDGATDQPAHRPSEHVHEHRWHLRTTVVAIPPPAIRKRGFIPAPSRSVTALPEASRPADPVPDLARRAAGKRL